MYPWAKLYLEVCMYVVHGGLDGHGHVELVGILLLIANINVIMKCMCMEYKNSLQLQTHVFYLLTNPILVS